VVAQIGADADGLLGGKPTSCLIVDESSFPKQGGSLGWGGPAVAILNLDLWWTFVGLSGICVVHVVGSRGGRGGALVNASVFMSSSQVPNIRYSVMAARRLKTRAREPAFALARRHTSSARSQTV
jgi:hypothetical protein